MPNMIKISLLDKNNELVKVVDVDQETIAEASLVIYQGVHYQYSGMSGRFFQDVKFVQCNAPVNIGE